MNSSAPARTRLLQACYSFLVPIARFLLRSGISFREFAEVSRIAFVNVASEDYGIRGRPTNISRISAMTGVSRKEVSRVRKLRADYEANLKSAFSPLANILQHWYTDPAYVDETGTPRMLSLSGPRPSFSELVRECAGDRPVRAMVTEVIRCGAVIEETAGRLRAVRRDVIAHNMDEKLISRMAFALRGLASTIAHNSDPATSAEHWRREITIESEEIGEKVRRELEDTIRERITTFANQVDDLLSQARADSGENSRRIGVGVYYYEDEAAP
jgi:signal transduction histidine kinase